MAVRHLLEYLNEGYTRIVDIGWEKSFDDAPQGYEETKLGTRQGGL